VESGCVVAQVPGTIHTLAADATGVYFATAIARDELGNITAPERVYAWRGTAVEGVLDSDATKLFVVDGTLYVLRKDGSELVRVVPGQPSTVSVLGYGVYEVWPTDTAMYWVMRVAGDKYELRRHTPGADASELVLTMDVPSYTLHLYRDTWFAGDDAHVLRNTSTPVSGGIAYGMLAQAIAGGAVDVALPYAPNDGMPSPARLAGNYFFSWTQATEPLVAYDLRNPSTTLVLSGTDARLENAGQQILPAGNDVYWSERRDDAQVCRFAVSALSADGKRRLLTSRFVQAKFDPCAFALYGGQLVYAYGGHLYLLAP